MSVPSSFAAAFVGLILLAGSGDAATVYVVRFDTSGYPVLAQPPCTYLAYRDSLVFYNAGASDAAVELLGVSNGTAASPQPLIVEAGSTRSTDGHNSAAATWAPDPQPLLWVARLDVPDQVEVVSRLLVPTATGGASCNVMPGGALHTFASVPLPVIRVLTPAGVPQVHLATDIGGNALGSDDGRTNVGIYNASSSTALATAELRRTCDGTLLESRSGFIPPNTVIQLNGFSEIFEGCSAIRAAGYESYVVVTVDQPSFSYTITLSNERPPWTAVSSSP